MASHTQVGGTIQLPDGRTIPLVVTLDLSQLPLGQAEPTSGNDALVARAIEVFRDREKAVDWLNSPNLEFAGRTPAEEAAAPDGLDRILAVLTSLEQGFPA